MLVSHRQCFSGVLLLTVGCTADRRASADRTIDTVWSAHRAWGPSSRAGPKLECLLSAVWPAVTPTAKANHHNPHYSCWSHQKALFLSLSVCLSLCAVVSSSSPDADLNQGCRVTPWNRPTRPPVSQPSTGTLRFASFISVKPQVHVVIIERFSTYLTENGLLPL